MPSVDEAIGADTNLAGTLADGVRTISYDQQILFTKYVRVVLPLDRFVFWVKAELVEPSAVEAAQLGFTPVPNQFSVQGSLHYASNTQQQQEETLTINQVVFTALNEVNEMNDLGPSILLIGEWEDIRFSFSSRSNFYRQAQLWHYHGDAIYADMEAQIISTQEEIDTFDSRSSVVSNSLPAWLSLNGKAQFPAGYGFANPVTLYPAFLSPQNLPPPFGVVFIEPSLTQALEAIPLLSPALASSQLARDTVTITLWGVRNDDAIQFLNCVLQWMADYGILGLMNVPVIRDEHRPQSELNAKAMKKTIQFEVSYIQRRMVNVARQVIRKSIPTFYVDGIAQPFTPTT